jgi:hypothetical protein
MTQPTPAKKEKVSTAVPVILDKKIVNEKLKELENKYRPDVPEYDGSLGSTVIFFSAAKQNAFLYRTFANGENADQLVKQFAFCPNIDIFDAAKRYVALESAIFPKSETFVSREQADHEATNSYLFGDDMFKDLIASSGVKIENSREFFDVLYGAWTEHFENVLEDRDSFHYEDFKPLEEFFETQYNDVHRAVLVNCDTGEAKIFKTEDNSLSEDTVYTRTEEDFAQFNEFLEFKQEKLSEMQKASYEEAMESRDEIVEKLVKEATEEQEKIERAKEESSTEEPEKKEDDS